MDSVDYVGIGVYSPQEVARYVRAQTQQIRRWFGAYDGTDALWQPQLPEVDGDIALGFLDLMEVRLVKELRLQKVPLQTIRYCIKRAQEITEETHPFATKHIKTDGQTLFLEIADQSGDRDLLNLKNSQWGFEQLIRDSLLNVEFDMDGAASRWFPLGFNSSVVLDPRINFGQPTLGDTGIPVNVVLRLLETDLSTEEVCEQFDITTKAANDSLAFSRIAA